MPLTETEQKYLIGGLQCLEGETKLQVNYEKLANLLELTNTKSANNGWSKAWKKVMSGVPLLDMKPKDDKTAATTASTKKAPAKHKAKTVTTSNTNDEAEAKQEDADEIRAREGGELLLRIASSAEGDTDQEVVDEEVATLPTAKTTTRGGTKGKAKATADTEATEAEPVANPAAKKATRAAAKPKVDADGNPLGPKKRAPAKPKASATENAEAGSPSKKRARSGPATKVDEEGNPLTAKRARAIPKKAIGKGKKALDEEFMASAMKEKKAEEDKVNAQVSGLLEGKITTTTGGGAATAEASSSAGAGAGSATETLNAAAAKAYAVAAKAYAEDTEEMLDGPVGTPDSSGWANKPETPATEMMDNNEEEAES